MKRFTLGLFVVCVAMFIVAFSPLPGPVMQTDLSFDRVLSVALMLVVGFASLAGVSKLVAILVNVLKAFGLVKDGQSANWAAGLNLSAFIGLIAFGVFRPDLALAVLDGYAGQLATVAIFAFGFYVQMTGSKSAHDALSDASVPLIGKSYTPQPNAIDRYIYPPL